MGWREVIISNRAKADLRYDNMIIRTSEGIFDFSISEISTLIIESTAVSITTALLARLMEMKVKVVLCDTARDPIAELVSYYSRHNSALAIKKQLNWDPGMQAAIWRAIVKDKIKKQADLLKRFNLPAYEKLEIYYEDVQLNDHSNREAHAAKVYFHSLFGIDFQRNKEGATNSALNYGYKIILSLFNRELVNQGCLTQIGIFHNNQFNPFNLSSDLMEPFRPLVDEQVYAGKFQEFGTPEKRKLQNLYELQLKIEGKSYFLKDVIRIYTKSIIRAIEQEDLSLIRTYEV